jgi:hypothetical protein
LWSLSTIVTEKLTVDESEITGRSAQTAAAATDASRRWPRRILPLRAAPIGRAFAQVAQTL